MSSAAPVLFKGHPVQLAGVTYVMPALSFGGIDQAKDLMRQIDTGALTDVTALQGAFTDVLHLAFLRNYPEMPRQVLLDALDWHIAVGLYRRLLQLSFPQAPAGEPVVESPSGALTGS
jgi:hypothetical protein